MENITKAILAVMSEVKWIEKNSEVGKGNFAYKGVNDQDVKKVIGESMQKNWLVLVPISVEPTTQIDRWEEDDTYNKQPPYPKKSKQSIFTEVKTKYLLMHKSGESIELAGYGQGVDTQDKGAGKATTYALKYALLYTFLVPTGAIDDADKTHSNDHQTPQATKIFGKQARNDLVKYVENSWWAWSYDDLKVLIKKQGYTVAKDWEELLMEVKDKLQLL